MEEFQKKVEDENKMLHERIQLQVKQTQDNKEEVMQSLKVIQDMIGASMNCVGARNQRYLQISSKCTICCSPCRKDEGNSAKTPKAPLFEVRNLSAIPILEMGEGSVHFPNPHLLNNINHLGLFVIHLFYLTEDLFKAKHLVNHIVIVNTHSTSNRKHVDFPIFDGDYPEASIRKVEKYFSLTQTLEDEKVLMAEAYITG
ncbi:hypothetical protein OsI_30576 [Oryza sativa Indica Group]|uniref:Uncharacterized protein n=1 Tax=Oryza sativa subsp. indica TaxID=39946 RepID=A2YZ12_ORYSI|nr:hypothetical protein OsI_30576 [Oryza sativa Indica Group]